MNKKTFRESEHISAEYATRKGPQRRYRARTLDNSCPVLHDFLKPGMKVLDMKCGQGTITLDVARQVRRGSVVGMDPNEKALENTRAAAEQAKLENVEFRAGYTYSIDFPDGTFDLVYSHAMLSWLQEPVKAFREQARVARSGAWVVTMTRSYDYLVLYPECPELRRIMKALGALKEAPKGVGFFNAFAPHEVVSYLVNAGFRNYKIISFTPDLSVGYPGSKCFENCYHTLLNFGLDDFPRWHEYFLDKGLIDRDTTNRAMAEVEAWYHHPHALFLQPTVAACGQVD